jgi:hypothetical protein
MLQLRFDRNAVDFIGLYLRSGGRLPSALGIAGTNPFAVACAGGAAFNGIVDVGIPLLSGRKVTVGHALGGLGSGCAMGVLGLATGEWAGFADEGLVGLESAQAMRGVTLPDRSCRSIAPSAFSPFATAGRRLSPPSIAPTRLIFSAPVTGWWGSK